MSPVSWTEFDCADGGRGSDPRGRARRRCGRPRRVRRRTHRRARRVDPRTSKARGDSDARPDADSDSRAHPTPTPTPTATASPTPTTTATPTATPNTEQYRPFVKQYVEELRIFTVIYSAPVELRGSRVVDDELWIAANITSLAVNESRRYDQYDALLFSYAKANEKHYTRRIAGKAPSGFRVVEVGTRPGDDPLTLRVNRSVARRHTEWELNVSETRVIWADSRRTPTDRERETAADIDRGGRNLTIAPGSGQQESEGDG